MSKAEGNFKARQSKQSTHERIIAFIFKPQDLDPDFDIPINFIFKGPAVCPSIRPP